MTEQIATPANPNMPQHSSVEECLAGEHFSLVQVGDVKDLMRYVVDSPRLGVTLPGKLFLNEPLGLSAMEISYGIMPPHMSIPFYHKHQQNEEVYLFFGGSGQFQVDGQVLEVRDGTAIRVAPAGVRAFRNTSDQPLFYIVIQAKEGSLEQWTRTDGVGVPGQVEWPQVA